MRTSASAVLVATPYTEGVTRPGVTRTRHRQPTAFMVHADAAAARGVGITLRVVRCATAPRTRCDVPTPSVLRQRRGDRELSVMASAPVPDGRYYLYGRVLNLRPQQEPRRLAPHDADRQGRQVNRRPSTAPRWRPPADPGSLCPIAAVELQRDRRSRRQIHWSSVLPGEAACRP
jgi:hypothetical protein